MAGFLIFSIGTQPFALPLENIIHVIRMVMITPVPAAPRTISGIINYHGEILPVYSIRTKFNIRQRHPVPSDNLIIALSRSKKIAIMADTIQGISDESNLISKSDIPEGIMGISGVVLDSDEMILITDLDNFLTEKESEELDLLIHSMER